MDYSEAEIEIKKAFEEFRAAYERAVIDSIGVVRNVINATPDYTVIKTSGKKGGKSKVKNDPLTKDILVLKGSYQVTDANGVVVRYDLDNPYARINAFEDLSFKIENDTEQLTIVHHDKKRDK